MSHIWTFPQIINMAVGKSPVGKTAETSYRVMMWIVLVVFLLATLISWSVRVICNGDSWAVYFTNTEAFSTVFEITVPPVDDGCCCGLFNPGEAEDYGLRTFFLFQFMGFLWVFYSAFAILFSIDEFQSNTDSPLGLAMAIVTLGFLWLDLISLVKLFAGLVLTPPVVILGLCAYCLRWTESRDNVWAVFVKIAGTCG